MAFCLTPRNNDASASVSLQSDTLKQFMQSVLVLIPKRTSLGILKTIRITISNDNCIFQVSNLRSTAILTVNSSFNGCMDIAVDYYELLGIIENSNGIVYLELVNNTLSVRYGTTSPKHLATIPGKDCPAIKHYPLNCASTSLSKFDISYIYKYLVPLCIKDKDYMGLCGILAESYGSIVSFSATNRNILTSTCMINDPTLRRVISTESIKIAHTLSKDFKLVLSDDVYALESDNVYICGEYESSVYPDIRRVLANKYDYVIPIDIRKLRASLTYLVHKTSPMNQVCLPVIISYGSGILDVHKYQPSYKYDGKCLKIDGLLLSKALERFDDNSSVTFKATCILEKPIVLEDSHGITFVSGMH